MDLSPKNIKRKFTDLWRTPDNIGRGLVRGAVLIFMARGAIKIVQLVRTVILARLLFPNDIGLFALASLAMNTTGVFLLNPGFSSAIVQEKGDIKKYLDSAWTVNLIRNIFLAIILFFLVAPLAGDFFHNSTVIPLTKVLALAFIIDGLHSISISLLQREFQFNKLFFYDVLSVIIEVVAVTVSAFILKNAWALVIGALVGKVAYLIFSYLLSSWRPHLTLDLSGAKHLFRFGKWIGLAGIITFLVSQGDRLVIGRLLEVSELGFYQFAFALGTLPAIEIGRSLGKILLPLYSKLQSDIKLLRKAFLKILRVVFSIIIPALVGIFILANEIVRFVYGTRWLPMVPILYVIIIYSLVKSFELMTNPLFLGIGRPRIQTLVLAIQSVAMFLVVIPLTKSFGAVGTAWAVLMGLVIAQLVWLFKLKKAIRLGLKTIIKTLSLPILASLVMLILIVLVKGVLPLENVFLLLAYVVGGAAVYFASVFVLDRIFGRKFYQSLLWIKKNI